MAGLALWQMLDVAELVDGEERDQHRGAQTNAFFTWLDQRMREPDVNEEIRRILPNASDELIDYVVTAVSHAVRQP